jgi:outer membrane lipoprotein-sorting protein
MKKLFLIIYLLLISCVQTNPNNAHQRVHAEYHDYRNYSGKTIKVINYYNNGSPYHMVITFTDGTTLDIVANKYVLDIQE